MVLVLAGLVAPMVLLGLDAFRADLTGELTLDNFSAVFSNPLDRDAIVNSLKLAVICATVATLAGMPLAWVIARIASRPRTYWLGLLNIAAQFTGIPLAFAFVASLGATGMITIALSNVGMEGLVPERDSITGLVVAYTYFNVPLFVLLVLPAIGYIREEWWEAAQTSGASRPYYWRSVGFPLLAPFALAGWFLIFTWSVGQYAAAYALAGSGAGSQLELITLRIGNTVQQSVAGVGRAAVHALLLLVMAVIALSLYRVAMKRGARWLA